MLSLISHYPTNNLDGYEDSEFIYINPFLTVVCTNPLSVAFYLNSVNDNITTLYQPVDTNSFNQFIVNNINIKRDALNGEDGYTITTKIAPSAMLPKEAFKLVEDDTLVLPLIEHSLTQLMGIPTSIIRTSKSY